MARDVNVRLDSGDKINIADFLPADPQQHFNQRQRKILITRNFVQL